MGIPMHEGAIILLIQLANGARSDISLLFSVIAAALRVAAINSYRQGHKATRVRVEPLVPVRVGF
jgi:hypothetical protein